MSHPDRDPAWQTTLKLFGAVALVLLALAFGAMGTCGTFASIDSLVILIRGGGTRDQSYYAAPFGVLGVVFAVAGLGLAGLAIRALVVLLREWRDRNE